MHWNWRKIGIVLVVTLLVISGVAYGAYEYLLYRYSRQIDDLLSELLNEPSTSNDPEPVDAIADAPVTEAAPRANDRPADKPDLNASLPAPDVSQPPDSPVTQRPDVPEEEQTEAGAPDNPLAGAVAQATDGLSLTDSEMDLVGDLPSLLGKMTSEEKLMLLKTLMKFSPSEILNLYRLYEGGDAETKAQVKEQVKAKFSAEDIELIKQMAAKYR